MYVYVGGAGSGDGAHGYRAGGWNGGGNATSNSDGNTRQAAGGGATHIAKVTGELASLSSNSSQVLIVAGGGGGWYGGGVGLYSVGGGSGYIGGVTNGEMTNGVRSGHGYAKITFYSP